MESMIETPYGKITIISHFRKRSAGQLKHMVFYICHCGNRDISPIHGFYRKVRPIKSCGCIKKRTGIYAAGYSHGLSKLPGYRNWSSMRKRCLNIGDTDYHHYGGRGITICERWVNSFENFISDMGIPPKKHSIERIDNNGNYCPENCKWVTQQEQVLNQRSNVRIDFGDGIVWTQSQVTERLGISTYYLQKMRRAGKLKTI